ncbi:hypothetical protein [Microvirga tunisiensis]|uniref:hypothetical protein n=1 Tax=Microvirga tunisiensis TaxID=2108360 RepID=UPI0012C4C980|nr:hypothetical protein [Microvirga tunisiensis]
MVHLDPAAGAAKKEPACLPLCGEKALVTPIGEDLALITGVADAMPDSVQVLLNGDPSMTMTASVITWKRNNAPAEARIGFVAVLPIRLQTKVRLTSVVIRHGHPFRYALVRPAVSVTSLVKVIVEDTGDSFGEVSNAIVQALASGGGGAKRSAAAIAVLTASARTDGWVEVMGSLDTGEVFLQGWAHSLPDDVTHVIVSHDGFGPAEIRSAGVERTDLGGQGRGFVALLSTANGTVLPEKLQKVFFRTKDGWRTLDVYERKVLLPTTDVPAHIREGIPRANASQETMSILRRAGERFDGRDTVSHLKQPVRMGMDMVVEIPGGGLLVAGWMLDPEGLVESVMLRAGGGSTRVDNAWTRLPRPDVSAAFAGNELFAGRMDPQRHDHGFLAFVPGVSAAGDVPVYFEFEVDPDSIAFYPLQVMRAMSRRTLERLVSPLDPRTAAAAIAIERHIGPMMQATEHPAPRIVETRDFGFDDAGAAKALVVGAGADAEEIGVTLSLLALDPEARDIPVIISAPIEAFGTIAAEVERLARFYHVGVRLIASEGVQDSCDSFEAAVHATKADTLVFLSAGVLPRRSGWLSGLERAYRKRGGKALVSPTIVFEDDSICFAGTMLDESGRGLSDRYLGYPRDVIRGAEASEVMAGTTTCCIVSRKVIEAAGGFARSYLGTSDKGRDLCLKLRLAGTPSVWLPDVEMVSADNTASAGLPWRRLAQRIDRWSFDRKWSLLINNMN